MQVVVHQGLVELILLHDGVTHVVGSCCGVPPACLYVVKLLLVTHHVDMGHLQIPDAQDRQTGNGLVTCNTAEALSSEPARADRLQNATQTLLCDVCV